MIILGIVFDESSEWIVSHPHLRPLVNVNLSYNRSSVRWQSLSYIALAPIQTPGRMAKAARM